MFGNFSLFELLVVGALALIVIGPKDLPQMMRALGKMMAQARGMARQFQDSMNEAAREADLTELNDARKMLTSKSPGRALTNALNETLDFDDDKPAAEKPVDPALSGDDLQARAEASGFGDAFAGRTPPPAEAPALTPTTEPASVDIPDEAAADVKTG